ncbi:hypothetical protein MGMO_16c00030 [Methyloglobulus morosus KoM1]|uniref:Uncharacterized protein n=1 Tax=Methyloglobulus morosus KoM1 TaxID=1116472 RepID=V5C0H6_9GAMM|nr:hypothetical protein [Methyloglobulus morosus]ESS73569.1 hypothetical protein MGMO_16c00030 [Methyloglobulus morosus KoM1]
MIIVIRAEIAGIHCQGGFKITIIGTAYIIAMHPVALQLRTPGYGRDCHREEFNNYFPGTVDVMQSVGNN